MESNNSCPVCHEGIEIYAVGCCDHVICYKCSCRMRVLCEQFYCPICRTDLPQVSPNDIECNNKQLSLFEVILREQSPSRKGEIPNFCGLTIFSVGLNNVHIQLWLILSAYTVNLLTEDSHKFTRNLSE